MCVDSISRSQSSTDSLALVVLDQMVRGFDFLVAHRPLTVSLWLCWISGFVNLISPSPSVTDSLAWLCCVRMCVGLISRSTSVTDSLAVVVSDQMVRGLISCSASVTDSLAVIVLDQEVCGF